MPEVFSNYVNGEWLKAPALFENRNPADRDEVVGCFARGTGRDIESAAEAASAALPGWAGMSGPGRGNILFRAADILDRKFEQISSEMTREEGKTVDEA